MRRHSSQPPHRLISRLARHLLTLAILSLVILHLWILWRRLAAGNLLDAEVAMRWLGAGLLGLGAFWLRRQGLSLWRGRSAVVFWLAVLLLHAGVPASVELGAPARDVPAELILLLSIPVGSFWLLSRQEWKTVTPAPPIYRRLKPAAPRPPLASHYAPILRRPPPF